MDEQARDMTAAEWVRKYGEQEYMPSEEDSVLDYLWECDGAIEGLDGEPDEHRWYYVYQSVAIIGGRYIGFNTYSFKNDMGSVYDLCLDDNDEVWFAKLNPKIVLVVATCKTPSESRAPHQYDKAPEGMSVKDFVIQSQDFKKDGSQDDCWFEFIVKLPEIDSILHSQDDYHRYYKLFVVIDNVLVTTLQGVPRDEEGWQQVQEDYDVGFGSVEWKAQEVWL